MQSARKAAKWCLRGGMRRGEGRRRRRISTSFEREEKRRKRKEERKYSNALLRLSAATFYLSSRLFPLFLLRRHRPEPVGDALEQRDGEARLGLDEAQEVAAAAGQQLKFCVDRGASRARVEG